MLGLTNICVQSPCPSGPWQLAHAIRIIIPPRYGIGRPEESVAVKKMRCPFDVKPPKGQGAPARLVEVTTSPPKPTTSMARAITSNPRFAIAPQLLKVMPHLLELLLRDVAAGVTALEDLQRRALLTWAGERRGASLTGHPGHKKHHPPNDKYPKQHHEYTSPEAIAGAVVSTHHSRPHSPKSHHASAK